MRIGQRRLPMFAGFAVSLGSDVGVLVAAWHLHASTTTAIAETKH